MPFCEQGVIKLSHCFHSTAREKKSMAEFLSILKRDSLSCMAKILL